MTSPALTPATTPEFPHGTEAGHLHRCRCSPCVSAWGKASGDREMRAALVAADDRDAVAFMFAGENLASLLAFPYVTAESIAVAIGSSVEAIRRAVNFGDLWDPALARKLAMLAPEDILEATAMAPAAELTLAVGQLRALGYPAWWQQERTQVQVAPTLDPMGLVPASSVAAIRQLTSRVRERVATITHGIGRAEIEQTMEGARVDGYYPPACYDDDGDLILNAVPGTEHDRADGRARDRLRIAVEHLADPTMSVDGLALLTETTTARVEKVVQIIADIDDPAERKRIAAVIAEWEDGEVPVLLCALRAGLLSVRDRNLPRDHPDCATFRDELARAQMKVHA